MATKLCLYLYRCARRVQVLIDRHGRNHRHTAASYYPTQHVRPSRVYVTFVSQRFVAQESVNDNKLERNKRPVYIICYVAEIWLSRMCRPHKPFITHHQEQRRGETPTESPINARHVAHHVFDVVAKPIDACKSCNDPVSSRDIYRDSRKWYGRATTNMLNEIRLIFSANRF